MKKNFTFLLGLIGASITPSVAQNIFSGEPVQIVGAFNKYATTPYNSDYRTTNYRKLTFADNSNPKDGRGQWTTTLQAGVGDVAATNMTGGGGNGFLFITGPVANRFQNKWAFNGIGQGAANGVNNTVYNGSTDMGLNLSDSGSFYTFVFNDCGYTNTNAKFYVGKTKKAPVTVTQTSDVVNADGSITISISTNDTLSPEENIYVRYIIGNNDFSGKVATTIVQATGNNLAFTATIPAPIISGTNSYYVFTSTRNLAAIAASSETDKSLSALQYDDNAGMKYVNKIILPIAPNIFKLEPIQVVGVFNGYKTDPYNSDYRTTAYRKLAFATAGSPTDGRGQWATTIQVGNADAGDSNMVGGPGKGFLFISGPSTNRFANKWVFKTTKQADINAVNTAYKEGSTDIGLDLSLGGYYTFVMNDVPYSDTTAQFYIGRTFGAPVGVQRMGEIVNADGSVTVQIGTTGGFPSPVEKVYVRYVYGDTSNFSGSSATGIVQATGAGVTYTATIPASGSPTTINYYIFTSTIDSAAFSTATETEKSIGVLKYDDNSGANYVVPVVLPITIQSFGGSVKNSAVLLEWKTATEINAKGFVIEKLTNNAFTAIGTIAATNKATGNAYHFTDASAAVTNIYRLKLIDKDGSFSYSKSIVVSKTGTVVSDKIQLYPTITTGNITINTHQLQDGKISLQLFTTTGKLLQQKTLLVTAGNNLLPYKLPNVPKGWYLVAVQIANVKQVFEILVQ